MLCETFLIHLLLYEVQRISGPSTIIGNGTTIQCVGKACLMYVEFCFMQFFLERTNRLAASSLKVINVTIHDCGVAFQITG